jgi:hypothetical protein
MEPPDRDISSWIYDARSRSALETAFQLRRFSSAEERGFSDDDIQASLIGAAASGWVIAVEDRLHLSGTGHTLLHPANDN